MRELEYLYIHFPGSLVEGFSVKSYFLSTSCWLQAWLFPVLGERAFTEMKMLVVRGPLSTLKGPRFMYGWGTVKFPTDAWKTLCALPIQNLSISIIKIHIPLPSHLGMTSILTNTNSELNFENMLSPIKCLSSLPFSLPCWLMNFITRSLLSTFLQWHACKPPPIF